MQQADPPAPPPPAASVEATNKANQSFDILVPSPHCKPDSDGEVVVCGHRNSDQFRLSPLPPLPVSNGLLSRPLRVQIAPGVSFGFQRGGGFGVKAEFGPGKKTDEEKTDKGR